MLMSPGCTRCVARLASSSTRRKHLTNNCICCWDFGEVPSWTTYLAGLLFWLLLASPTQRSQTT